MTNLRASLRSAPPGKPGARLDYQLTRVLALGAPRETRGAPRLPTYAGPCARRAPEDPRRASIANLRGVVQVAGDVAAVHARQLRLVDRAMRHDFRTARVEPAARRRVERARHVAGQHDIVAGVVGVRRERGGEQRLRVRMARPRNERARVAR